MREMTIVPRTNLLLGPAIEVTWPLVQSDHSHHPKHILITVEGHSKISEK